jgi:LMBR1 domain-containing protein 1
MRLKNSVIWTVVSVCVFGAILAILYIVGGKVAYDTTLLSSGLAPLSEFATITAAGCIALEGGPADGCNALADNVKEEVFKVRPSFVIFVIAVASILGWLLLMVMGGVGLIALPLDMILAYVSPQNCSAACACGFSALNPSLS